MQRRGRWGAGDVRKLRQALGLSQQAFAAELGIRQQTVSDWETGAYAPRGASVTLLNIVAERAATAYGPERDPEAGDGGS